MIGIVVSILVYKARFPKDKAERIRKGFLYHEHVAKHDTADEYYNEVTQKKRNFRRFCQTNL